MRRLCQHPYVTFASDGTDGGSPSSSPVEGRSRALIDLVREHLPLDGPYVPPEAVFPVVGPALIARQAGTLDAILRLGRHGSDSLVLVRSLYDHAVTFAWLAAEPGSERSQQFMRDDAASRLRADNDCRTLGVPILTDAMRAFYEVQKARHAENMPKLICRAELADDHWGQGQLPGFGSSDSTHSYRGMYAVAYRRQSAYEHASGMGIGVVIGDLPDGRKRVDLEGASQDVSTAAGYGSILLHALKPEDRALWATALYAGLRLGELRGLDWEHVDLASGTITVARSYDPKAGFVEPKSRAGRRRVPVPSVLRDALIEHKLVTGRGAGLVFGRAVEVPFSPSSVNLRAARAWSKAGLEPIGLHECRHTCASYFIAAGINAKTLSTFLGHASITTTLDRYGHLFPGSEAEAAGMIDAYLARADTGARIAQLAPLAPPEATT